MKFLERLEELMKERNMNKSKLSKGSGVPYTTLVSYFERRVENVKISTLIKLANYFGVTVDYLVGNDTTPATEHLAIESATIKKQLVIEIDVITGKMDVINNDEMSYIEVMGALEYAKMMFIKDWLGS